MSDDAGGKSALSDKLGAECDERLRLETMLAHRWMLDTAHRLCNIKVAAERDRTLSEVLRGLRSENDSEQLRAIIASVEALRSNVELTGGASAPSSDRRERG